MPVLSLSHWQEKTHLQSHFPLTHTNSDRPSTSRPDTSTPRPDPQDWSPRTKPSRRAAPKRSKPHSSGSSWWTFGGEDAPMECRHCRTHTTALSRTSSRCRGARRGRTGPLRERVWGGLWWRRRGPCGEGRGLGGSAGGSLPPLRPRRSLALPTPAPFLGVWGERKEGGKV